MELDFPIFASTENAKIAGDHYNWHCGGKIQAR